MYTLLIKTQPFVDKFLKKEIKELTGSKPKTIEKGLYELKLKKEELIEIVPNLIYYSRLIENIYIQIKKFGSLEFLKLETEDLTLITKPLTFSVRAEKSFEEDHQKSQKKVGEILLNTNKNLKVNLDKPDLTFKLFKFNGNSYLAIDLVGFKLSKRTNPNLSSSSINSLIPSYCNYLLELDEYENYKILDPCADLGEIIIETALFKAPMHIKQRATLSFTKLFSTLPPLPKKNKDKSSFIAVVQNNKIFKQLRENINFSGQKIKISQYELDWLDVKFKKGDTDNIITQFPSIKDEIEFEEFQKEFFYQAEFVSDDKICVISKRELNKDIIKKNKLKIKKFEEIYIGDMKYFIYLIK